MTTCLNMSHAQFTCMYMYIAKEYLGLASNVPILRKTGEETKNIVPLNFVHFVENKLGFT